MAPLPGFNRGARAGEGFVKPSKGSVSSPYGLRNGRFHTGIDWLPDRGREVRAVGQGAVIHASTKGDCGKTVIIYHRNNVASWYCHLNRFQVAVGEAVQKGQTIAEMGSTGKSTDTHLHFEIRIGKRPVDPMTYFKKTDRPAHIPNPGKKPALPSEFRD